jgi:hypothetical protein
LHLGCSSIAPLVRGSVRNSQPLAAQQIAG